MIRLFQTIGAAIDALLSVPPPCEWCGRRCSPRCAAAERIAELELQLERAGAPPFCDTCASEKRWWDCYKCGTTRPIPEWPRG